MIELIQFPWSPFCIVQKRILEYSGAAFEVTDIPSNDRSVIWRLTRQRYYGVPILRDGRKVIFEVSHDSQVIGKYLDNKLGLGLFPRDLEGLQSVLWRDIENGVEDAAFRLNDIYWKEMVPPLEQVGFLRHKERKFGRGCLDQWRREQKPLLAELAHRLLPYDQMLIGGQFLLGDQPHFVDFDLYGMIGNFLYSGHYRLPAELSRLKKWHSIMTKLQPLTATREKLRS